jgi:hypothetical protein
MIAYLSPGLRFFPQGQFEGRRKRISPHLVRAPIEPADETLQLFYDRLLEVLRQRPFRDGRWRLLECASAWDSNWTSDCFVACCWQEGDDLRRLIAVNYAGNQSQCYVRLPFAALSGSTLRLEDLTGPYVYDRDGDELVSRGLYLDLPPWSFHVFEVTTIGNKFDHEA